MRIVIQEVLKSAVKSEGKLAGEIGPGELLLVGFKNDDKEEIIDKMIAKLLKLRIFPDAAGKTNLSLQQTDGEILAVSQFTLYADLSEGNRPSFVKAMAPEEARRLFKVFQERLIKAYPKTKFGVFQTDMEVSLVNNGPFTIILDSEELFK